MPDQKPRLDAALRITAALAGTTGPALLAAASLAAYLPCGPGLRFAIAFFAFIPLWVTAMTLTFLVKRGWLAWLLCLLVTAALALATPEAAAWPALP